jgi:hypothetical protein
MGRQMNTTDVDALVAHVPEQRRPLYRRALEGTASPRQAIKVKCFECCGWIRSEGGEDRIGDCRVPACPLWALRPFQDAPEASRGAEGSGSDEEVDPDGSGIDLDTDPGCAHPEQEARP